MKHGQVRNGSDHDTRAARRQQVARLRLRGLSIREFATEGDAQDAMG